MSKLFFLALAATLVYFFARTLFSPIRKPAAKPQYKKGESEPATEMVQDPVCGVFIDANKALRLENRGVLYYFCSEQCENKFQKKIAQGEKL